MSLLLVPYQRSLAGLSSVDPFVFAAALRRPTRVSAKKTGEVGAVDAVGAFCAVGAAQSVGVEGSAAIAGSTVFGDSVDVSRAWTQLSTLTAFASADVPLICGNPLVDADALRDFRLVARGSCVPASAKRAYVSVVFVCDECVFGWTRVAKDAEVLVFVSSGLSQAVRVKEKSGACAEKMTRRMRPEKIRDHFLKLFRKERGTRPLALREVRVPEKALETTSSAFACLSTFFAVVVGDDSVGITGVSASDGASGDAPSGGVGAATTTTPSSECISTFVENTCLFIRCLFDREVRGSGSASRSGSGSGSGFGRFGASAQRDSSLILTAWRQKENQNNAVARSSSSFRIPNISNRVACDADIGRIARNVRAGKVRFVPLVMDALLCRRTRSQDASSFTFAPSDLVLFLQHVNFSTSAPATAPPPLPPPPPGQLLLGAVRADCSVVGLLARAQSLYICWGSEAEVATHRNSRVVTRFRIERALRLLSSETSFQRHAEQSLSVEVSNSLGQTAPILQSGSPSSPKLSLADMVLTANSSVADVIAQIEGLSNPLAFWRGALALDLPAFEGANEIREELGVVIVPCVATSRRQSWRDKSFALTLLAKCVAARGIGAAIVVPLESSR